jgi:hypothetical protein
MSARLTVLFFILICFEIGILLIYLPWHRSWGENHLLIMAADRLHWPSLIRLITSGYTRGAVTGLGFFNIMLGGWEIFNFKRTVRAFQREWRGDEPQDPAASGLPDNPPAGAGANRR